MGQKQVLNVKEVPEGSGPKVPTFIEVMELRSRKKVLIRKFEKCPAVFSRDEESIIQPNGYFPPEIVEHVLKYADFKTMVQSSQVCKLWYESITAILENMYITRYGSSESLEENWKVNFYRRMYMDQNLVKGRWWAEALSSFHYPRWDTFSYVATFEGNKVIFNNHHIHITSYSDSKFFEAAYELDLDTMQKVPVPYGTIFANGYRIRTLVENDYEYFDWKEFHIENIDRQVKRKFEPPHAPEWYRRTHYRLHVNLDGSPTICTANEYRNYYSEDLYTRYIEVVDLRTGEIIAEPKLEAQSIIAFLGDAILASFPDGIFLTNIYTNERMEFCPPTDSHKIYYCKETHTLAQAYEAGVIFFIDWPSLQFKSKIDVKAKLAPPILDTDMGAYYEFSIRGFAFDKSKLVVAMGTQATFYAVFDMNTGDLIQTFYNNTDAQDPRFCRIYLAPNGKIVTDCSNLTVYDFASPKIFERVPMIYAEVNSTEVTKLWCPAYALAKFVAWKLDVSFPNIQHATFFGKTINGLKYRITGIGSHGKDRNDWDQWQSVDWSRLSDYLQAWKADNEVRNTFQMTLSNYSYPEDSVGGVDITWNRLRKVILIYEWFNEDTKEWEFTDPIQLDELAIAKDDSDEE